MALKGQMSRTFLNIGCLAVDVSMFFFLFVSWPTGSVSARPAFFHHISKFDTYSKADPILQGLSIPDVKDLPVVQQPAGNTNYVSENDGEVTQFSAVTPHGNIVLLAHNYLSGQSFSKLAIGQEVLLVYEDGKAEEFIVTEILRYQALDPKSPYSSFQNLNDKDEVLTVGQMFDRAYLGKRHLTLQTCIAAEGNASWGRLFVIASPKSELLGLESSNLYLRP